MAKKEKDEIAVTAAQITEKNHAAHEEEKSKESKENLFKKVNRIVGTVQEVGSNVNEFYVNWIKPIYDNRAQIKRRLNVISTIVSIIFFILYVPFLLFSKIANGLSLGWDVALYTCVGVYAVMLILFLIVSIASGKSTSTEMAKRRKRATKIVLYIVRIASVAIAITALFIMTSEQAEKSNPVLSTVGIVFSIISIIFASLPLIFGSFGGFLKWLISPGKIKRTVSFVALEWYSLITSPNTSPTVKKINKKHFDMIATTLDSYILPAIGKRKATQMTGMNISAVIANAPPKNKSLVKAILQNVFDYAVECGYTQINPCDELGLPGDIESAAEEARPKKQNHNFFYNLFHKKTEQDEKE